MSHDLKRLSHKTLRIKTPYTSATSRRVLAMADIHFDNRHCQTQLVRKHLEEAKETKSLAFFFGDTFCLMQGPGDRRRSKVDRHDADADEAAYINSVLHRAWEFFSPYAHIIAGISYGNHETSYARNNGIDVLELFIDGLNARTGAKIERMPYSGWIHQSHEYGKGSRRHTHKIYYHHGSGGGGPVTRGAIKTNRRNATIEGADFVVSGHIHESFAVETPKIYTNSAGKEIARNVVHCQLPTYKDERLSDGDFFNYHEENERPAKPLGGWWLRMDGRLSGPQTIWTHHADRAL